MQININVLYYLFFKFQSKTCNIWLKYVYAICSFKIWHNKSPVPDFDTLGTGRQESGVVRTEAQRPHVRPVSREDQLGHALWLGLLQLQVYTAVL